MRGETRRGEVGRLARWLQCTTRTLNNWKRLAAVDCDPPRPPGRPPHPPEARTRARLLVREQLEVQGWSVGEAPVCKALGPRGVPTRLVREALRELKAEQRSRHDRARAERRCHVEVLARDAMWSIDATHLGRDDQEEKVIGEAVREVASTRTLSMSIGPVPSSADVVALLERSVDGRGTLPLVAAIDNGGENLGMLTGWLEEHRVIALRNLPHTPEHNPWIEHGFGELKAETGLGKNVRIPVLREAVEDIADAIERLDAGRLRATRGWRTAVDFDRDLPPAEHRVPRARFYRAARCAMRMAVQNCHTERQRRLAEREAVLTTLEWYSLIKRTRGHARNPADKSEGVS